MLSHGRGRWSIEFSLGRGECFTNEKMWITQSFESSPQVIQFRLEVNRAGNSENPSEQTTEYPSFVMRSMAGEVLYVGVNMRRLSEDTMLFLMKIYV